MPATSSPSQPPPLDAEAARAACARLLGEPAGEVARPGGPLRRSVRVACGGRTVIVTCRPDRRRAGLEAMVIEALERQAAPVPRLLAFDGTWLIQEDVGGRRLSEALAEAGPEEVERLLDSTLASLDRLHRAGRAEGLERRVVALGSSPDWRRRLLGRAGIVAGQVGVPAPRPPEAALIELLRLREPWLIKWDARPGNALVGAGSRLTWIDLEHCGCRNRLDDLAWLLCDEYVPDLAEVEARLLDRHLPIFAEGWDPGEAAGYLAAYGTCHGLVRLSVILDRKGKGPWWDRRRSLAADMPDVSKEAALAVARRAQRWAGREPLTARLLPWLDAVGRRIEAAPD